MTTSHQTINTKVIFITGFPRSGTTWFANLINAHPLVIYRHEVIGRCFSSFPESLFNALKYEHGLNDSDYKSVIDTISVSRIETDRPPFFKKEYLWISSPNIHQVCWLLANAISLLRPFYQFLFKPRTQKKIIAIKETRSSTDMESIITGLRTCNNIILFRHPCGCVASSLSGIQTGKMLASTTEERKSFSKKILESKAFQNSGLSEADICSMPEYEYLAVLWRVQNDDYIEFREKFRSTIFISYENFVQSTVENTKKLFSVLTLPFDKNVEEFVESSSNTSDNLSVLKKDSGSTYYSVYRKSGFNQDKWKQTLKTEQINSIEKYTLDTYNELLSFDSAISSN